VRRFCELIDPDSPVYDARYVTLVLAQSASLESSPPAAETAKLLRRMNQCPFRSIGAVGCGCGLCALRGATVVNHFECLDCLQRFA
jgi:hypothetical protein